MGQVYEAVEGSLRSFIEAQHVFFVASAPADGGHVNLSPKGLDTLRILDGRTVVYLDYVGSGAETIAHLRDNGRIVLMVCAFEGPPKIVRLHGRGEPIEPSHVEYAGLRSLFPPDVQARSMIRVNLERISDSCGYGVPLFAFQGHRRQLPAWAERKGEDGLIEYQKKNNRASIDGLPALDWAHRGSDA
jgi:hypothetical protein